MKDQNKQKSLSKRRTPLKKERRTAEPSQTTKLQEAFKHPVGGNGESEEPVQPIKRVSKGADEEME